VWLKSLLADSRRAQKPKSLVQAAVALRLGDFMFAGGLPFRLTMGAMFGVADWIGWVQGTEEELLKRYWD
jgi:hypothetical protein